MFNKPRKNQAEKSAGQNKMIYLPKTMKLTKPEKEALNLALQRSKPNPKLMSAQDSLPFLGMMQDGTMRVAEGRYARMVRFFDVNYQLATNEDQEAIFNGWCDFLNYFSAEIAFQITCLSLPMDLQSYAGSIFIPPRKDAYDSIRAEYTTMLQNQLSRGNNGLVKAKYLTFTIDAPDIKTAKGRLERIEADVRSNFKRLGVSSQRMSGQDWLAVLHNAMHVKSQKFMFNWRWMVPSGLCEKDFIVPSSFEFGNARSFRIGETYAAVSFVQILASDLKDRVLKDFMDVESPQILSMHVQSVDQAKALKMVKTKITDLERHKIDEQKKAVRAGYDMDILPPGLEKQTKDTKDFLDDLQNHDEKMFLFTMLVVNTGDTKKKLDNNILQSVGVAKTHSCEMIRLDFQQEQGFFSALPFGQTQIIINRTMTTGSVAGFIPFTTHELFQQDGEPLYCGLNALSNNMIMVDRKKLKNPNGLILGTPGSGKSFSAKREILNVFLVTDDDIILSDPEAEYTALVQRLGGQIVKISPVSKDYINPMDLSMHYSDEEDDLLTLKSDFILSLFELITKDSLTPQDISIIDRCITLVYQPYLADPKPENMPILEDLYNAIGSQPDTEAPRLKAAMEIYVTGSLNVFNHRTNVNLHNRIVCFDVKELGNSALKKIGMLIVQDQVWNRVTQNRANKKATRYYMDEFHRARRSVA